MFITYEPSSAQLQQAMDMRAQRDTLYKNIYTEKSTDMRHVGELGELCLHAHLQDIGIKHNWQLDELTDSPDIYIHTGTSRLEIEVKTVKRQSRPLSHYTAQITANHIKKKVDGYFFLSYNSVDNIMYFLGFCDYDYFCQHAAYFGSGDFVHPNYQIRQGHEIYNIPIAQLFSSEEFFQHLSENPKS